VKAAGETLLVVGSLHHDLMLDAPHLPRQGETVTGHRWYPKFGGKGGNQAVAAARAGTPVRLLGAVGDDTFAAAAAERGRCRAESERCASGPSPRAYHEPEQGL